LPRRARKLKQSVDHIGACAWQLFERDGYANVTMEAVASAADVARATLYRHFPVKEALIAWRFECDQQQHSEPVLAGALAAPTLAAAMLFVLQLEAGYAERMRPYLGPFLAYRLHGQANSAAIGKGDLMYDLVLQLLERARQQGVLDSGQSARALTHHFAFLRLGVLMDWLAAPETPLWPRCEAMLTFFLRGAGLASSAEGGKAMA
jgi:AcrR family transcriptional regulator